MEIRRTLAMAIIVGMLLSGCAVLQKTAEVLCHPSEAQKNAAAAAITFLEAAAVLIGQPEILTAIDQAVSIFALIRDGICVTAEQLNNALNTVDQAGVVLQGQTVMARASRPAAPDLAVLRAWRR